MQQLPTPAGPFESVFWTSSVQAFFFFSSWSSPTRPSRQLARKLPTGPAAALETPAELVSCPSALSSLAGDRALCRTHASCNFAPRIRCGWCRFCCSFSFYLALTVSCWNSPPPPPPSPAPDTCLGYAPRRAAPHRCRIGRRRISSRERMWCPSLLWGRVRRPVVVTWGELSAGFAGWHAAVPYQPGLCAAFFSSRVSFRALARFHSETRGLKLRRRSGAPSYHRQSVSQSVSQSASGRFRNRRSPR